MQRGASSHVSVIHVSPIFNKKNVNKKLHLPESLSRGLKQALAAINVSIMIAII
jgi:hypothetical protein